MQGLNGDWIDVKPIEGTVVVNAGDLLMRWSNDLIKSTMHRVVEPPLPAQNGHSDATDGGNSDDPLYPARYSIGKHKSSQTISQYQSRDYSKLTKTSFTQPTSATRTSTR